MSNSPLFPHSLGQCHSRREDLKTYAGAYLGGGGKKLSLVLLHSLSKCQKQERQKP